MWVSYDHRGAFPLLRFLRLEGCSTTIARGVLAEGIEMPGSINDIVGSPSKLSKYIVGLDKALSWVVALVGLALSVWTAVMGDKVSTPWIIGIIAVDSVLLVLLGALSAVLFARQRMALQNETMQIRRKLDDAESERAGMEKAHRNALEAKDAAIRLGGELHEELLAEQASLSRITIEAINEISEIANKYYEQIERLSSILDLDEVASDTPMVAVNSGDGNKRNHLTIEVYKYCLENSEESLKSLKEQLFHEHGTFLKEILNTGCQMIRSHLLLRNHDLKVALCVKLFLEPDMDDELLANAPSRNIFTAFRDTRTFEQERRREKPPQLFSVKGNTDFEHCLATDSPYVFNNASKGGALRNESSYFGNLYNSGVTVEIVSKVKGSREPGLVYGFLACDVNNSSPEFDPMDESVANILISLRNLIALFYDQLNAVWDYACSADLLEDDEPEAVQNFFQAYYRYLD